MYGRLKYFNAHTILPTTKVPLLHNISDYVWDSEGDSIENQAVNSILAPVSTPPTYVTKNVLRVASPLRRKRKFDTKVSRNKIIEVIFEIS